MTSEEQLYLSSLFTHLKDEVSHIESVFFTPSCSNDFIEEFLIRFNIDESCTTRGQQKPHAKSRYSLVVSSDNDIDTTEKIKTYSKYLDSDGIIAAEVFNRHYLQSFGTKNTSTVVANVRLDSELSSVNLYPILREPTGKLTKFNAFKPNHLMNRFGVMFGKYFPNSNIYSPYIFLIYQLKYKGYTPLPYISQGSFSHRLNRISERSAYKIKNHKVNDYIVSNKRRWHIFFGFLQEVLLIHRYVFYTKITSSIQILPKAKGKQTIIVGMTYLQIGGVERVMLNILKGINRDRFIIHVLTTTPSRNPWNDEFLKYVDCIVHVPDLLDEAWSEKYRQYYVQEYASRNSADILFITNSPSSYAAVPIIKKRLPDVRIYDLLHTHGTPRDNDAYLRISLPFDKYIDKRIVIDTYLKDYYVNKYPINPDKVSVIYNGIDSSCPGENNDDNSDYLFNKIPIDRKIITFIGRLEDDKSPTRLVDIAIELRARNLPISIVVIGDGTLDVSMIKKATEAAVIDDYIYFYGKSNNPLPLAKRSDFTILVSNAEGIPMSVLESMSVSTPAISSAVGGIPEIVDHLQDGFLVPILSLNSENEKIKAFVDTIVQACALSKRDYLAMQTSAKKKVLARFSNMPEIYEHLFETGKILTEKSLKKK